ncbi:MAG: hypothetical protein J2P36_04080 [Ktedonobacteraceae bacterium]|nr:hypothetical protein [Ktedonobacteraceae bacterium]
MCAPGETPETDYKCFVPNEINCTDGECFQCDINHCIYDPDTPQILDQYVHLPAAKDNSLFIYTPPKLTVEHPVVVTLWKGSIIIVDVLLVVALMLHGIQIMIGGSIFRHANAVQAIPSILLALVAAHMSLLIAVFFVSFNNSLSAGMYSWAASNSAFNSRVNANTEASCDNLSDDERQVMFHEGKNGYLYPSDPHYGPYYQDTTNTQANHQLGHEWLTVTEGEPDYRAEEYQQYVNKISGQPVPEGSKKYYYLIPKPVFSCHRWDSEAFDSFNSFIKLGFVDSLKTLLGSITDFMHTVFGFSMLALLGQIVMRFLMLDLYIVTAPLWMGAWALPAGVGRPLTQSGMRGFISTVMVQFVQTTALLVAQGTMPIIDTQLKRVFPGSEKTLVWVIATVMVWFLLRIPSLLGTTPLSNMMDMGQRIAQTAGAVISHDIAIFQTILSVGGSVAGMATMGIGGALMGGINSAISSASRSVNQAANVGGEDESSEGRRRNQGRGGGNEDPGPEMLPGPRPNGGGPLLPPPDPLV